MGGCLPGSVSVWTCLYGRIRVCLGVWVGGCVSESASLSVCVCVCVSVPGRVGCWVGV